MAQTMQQRVDAARPPFEALSYQELVAKDEQLSNTLQQVADTIGEDYSLAKVTALGPGSEGEKAAKFDRMHVDASACRDVLSDRNQLRALTERIRAENGGGGAQDTAPNEDHTILPAARRVDGVRDWADPQALPDIGDLICHAPEVRQLGGLAQLAGRGQLMLEGVSLSDVMATTMTRSAGYPPFSIRSDKLQLSVQRDLNIMDVLPSITIQQQSYLYVEETTFTNNAAFRAEAGSLAESAFALTQRTITPHSVGTLLPVTREQLDDEMAVRQYLNQRLGYSVRRKIEDDIVDGATGDPGLGGGFLTRTGIGEQAKGTGANADDNSMITLFKAQTKVRVDAEEPATAYIVHPNDWQEMYLTVASTKEWLFGMPSQGNTGMTGMGARIWGLPVVLSTGMTENTALVGAFSSQASLIERQGIMIEVTSTHGDNFAKLIETFRAYCRIGLAVYRPAAFVKATGI